MLKLKSYNQISIALALSLGDISAMSDTWWHLIRVAANIKNSGIALNIPFYGTHDILILYINYIKYITCYNCII